MKEIKWQNEYSVLLKDIDEPRRFLAEKLSSFLTRISQNPSAEHIEELNALIDGFRIHFAKEEKILSKYKYPEVDIHRKEHKSYLRSLIRLRRKISEDPADADDETLNYLGDFFADHMSFNDQHYAPFIRLKKKIETHSLRK
jgi:hemerythrin-like metal-binding protein